jgi:hypothetical protein
MIVDRDRNMQRCAAHRMHVLGPGSNSKRVFFTSVVT